MISIIARPTYWARARRRGGIPYLQRVSTRIRGEEVAAYLGLKVNPETRNPGERYIFLKPRHLKPVQDGDYVDVLDDEKVIPFLKERPKVNVIAMSRVHYDYLRKELKNNIVLIYHHHINFERQTRSRNKKLVGGFISTPSQFAYDIVDEIKQKLAPHDIDFTAYFNFKERSDMIDYYKSIDFLVIWYFDFYERDSFIRHPTKMINAASFGIPSLGQPIEGYREFEGFYIPIETVEDIVREATKFKDQKYYDTWSKKLIKEAEKYHISNTSKLYLDL